jgi:hypothetical protein
MRVPETAGMSHRAGRRFGGLSGGSHKGFGGRREGSRNAFVLHPISVAGRKKMFLTLPWLEGLSVGATGQREQEPTMADTASPKQALSRIGGIACAFAGA